MPASNSMGCVFIIIITMNLTLGDLISTRSIEASALHLINQLLHNKSKAYLDNDGTYWDFGSNLSINIQKIIRSLHRHTYRFSPYLKRTKMMKNKKVRDLYHPTWPDRLVERWISECLGIKLHNWFSNNSYAYRIKEYCIDVCQWRVLNSISPNSLIIKRDISNCFYTIDHNILLEQLQQVVDKNDYLYELLYNRIKFEYHDGDDNIKLAAIGVPFGSSIACMLANIYLTKIDREMDRLHVKYFRYADDFLVVTDDHTAAVEAMSVLDNNILSLKASSKLSHCQNLSFVALDGFSKVDSFKYLGLEFTKGQSVRLGREKQRKIVNLVKRELSYIKLSGDIGERLKKCVLAVNRALVERIRSVAIVDYYLKHVTDERQLHNIDMLIVQLVVGAVLGKPFRYRDFSKISYRSVRKAGLVSLVHRRRLHAHGKLDYKFMNFYNQLVHARFERINKDRLDSINYARLKKLQQ